MTLQLKLFTHLFMEQQELPRVMPAPLVYVVAANGVYLWAKRQGLEALVLVQPCVIRDLFPVEPFVRLHSLPRVDAELVEEMLRRGRNARLEDGTPVETLFFLSAGECLWQLCVPPQHQTPTRVAPELALLDMDEYAQTLLEVHTHPLAHMPAFFSGIDDADEQQGFRLYGVIGGISRETEHVEAEIRMRVGVYGTFYEFPASWVMELPDGLR